MLSQLPHSNAPVARQGLQRHVRVKLGAYHKTLGQRPADPDDTLAHRASRPRNGRPFGRTGCREKPAPGVSYPSVRLFHVLKNASLELQMLPLSLWDI